MLALKIISMIYTLCLYIMYKTAYLNFWIYFIILLDRALINNADEIEKLIHAEITFHVANHTEHPLLRTLWLLAVIAKCHCKKDYKIKKEAFDLKWFFNNGSLYSHYL